MIYETFKRVNELELCTGVIQYFQVFSNFVSMKHALSPG